MVLEEKYVKSIEKEYIRLNPRSRQVYQKACRVMMEGNTRMVLFYRPYPIQIERGKASHIWDIDGNERIDFNFNFTVLVLGHNHPRIVCAVKQQLERGTVLGGPTELEVRLAENLAERLPSAEMVRFTPSGTEAVHQALRTARSYTGRNKIAKCEGAYHGSWDAVDISVSPPLEKAGPPASPSSVPSNEGVPQSVLKNTIVMPYNNIGVAEKIIGKYKDDLAALIIEPVQRGIPPKAGFLEAVREETERYGILLVFDEVITFRLGPGGAQKLYGVTPDITILGKTIGGGFPIGAYVASEEIMKPFAFLGEMKPRLSFSGTFNAFPISMAAGLAALNEMKEDAYENMNRLGQDLRVGLVKMLSEQNIRASIGGIGPFFHVFWTQEEVVDYRSLMTADPRLNRYFGLDLLNRGVYYRGYPNVSAVTTKEDVKQTLQAVKETLVCLKPALHEIAPRLVID